MCNVLLIGNPNVGKTTLFNSLTRSTEHTGNYHGVTTEIKSKIVTLEGKSYKFFDLPGLYSLNTFSFEENVARDEILKGNSINLVVADVNNLRKSLYLCLQLSELGIGYKLLINNYDYFLKKKNRLNLNNLKNKYNINAEIINAKKIKINKNILKNDEKYGLNCKYLKNFINFFKNKYNFDNNKIVLGLNGIYGNLTEEELKTFKEYQEKIILQRHKFIDEILFDCVEINSELAYGENKLDKLLLNPFFAISFFTLSFLICVYLTFFLIGPKLSNLLNSVLNFLFISPIMNFLYSITDSIWILEFFNSGLFSSILTIVSFVPQVVLLFLFLTILEDSGFVARLSYVLDDFLSLVGLTGKAVYILLLGFGCNTMSTLTTRNMNSKNLKIKTALINPYISCMARLPIFILLATTFFKKFSYLVVVGLYLLGLTIAFLMAFILNKTILKTEKNSFLLEFPILKGLDISHLFKTGVKNCFDFIKRIFTVVAVFGSIIWILTHTKFNLCYCDDIKESFLYFFASKLEFLFVPIGLNNAGIITALIVGVFAKELILSTFSICNGVADLKSLSASLVLSSSLICINKAQCFSFLIFALLYCPCLSNLAVLKAETDKFYMWFAIVSEFVVAYMLSFIVYNSIINSILFTLIVLGVILIIFFSLLYIAKKIKHRKCLMCGKCNINDSTSFH